jgi:hypothetical protein
MRMKYRCVEYSVYQDIGSGVWRWSASVGGVSITGLATRESEAVAGAENAIDRALVIKKACRPEGERITPKPRNFRPARMGKDKQKKTANVAQDGAVYGDDRFVRCKLCGSWINTRNPSSLLEHRGPLPHPRIAGAEWIDDDD